MARAGTQRWRNPAPEGDDVQRSIELLDKVLSEYDEHEVEGGSCVGEGGVGCGGGGGGGGGVSSTAGLATDCSSSTEPSIGLTPDDESPSLGHQSEDDGYMSMNGRKAKMALVALRPVPDCPEPQDPAAAPVQEFPPPPEEAERIISTLLPMVSPGNSTKRSVHHHHQQQQQQLQQQQREQPTSGQRRTARGTAWTINMDDLKRQGHAAVTTQTTLPKTRHQRPYGWENGGNKVEPFRLAEPPSPPSKFASLPYDGKVSFNWVPARANPGGAVSVDSASNASNKRRQSSEDGLEDLRQSSEDGLDEEDEVDDEDADGDEEGDDDDDDDDDDDAEDQSNRPSPDKERSASAAHNSHHHHHYHHPGSRRPPRQNEIIKSSSVEDRLLMNHNGPRAASSSSRNHNGGMATSAGCSERSASARRRRNNSDSSEGRFSRNSESERSSMPRSSSVSVERFSMRANCDSSDFSRANSMSNERFHSDFSIAMASASSNDHVSSVPSVDPFSIRNLDFVSFNLPHADSSERFSAQTSDREERYSEIYSTRNSDFSTRNSTDFRTQSEEEHFSDDSLEELLPPPPALSKRHSIAWEVSLEEDIYVPGSTKVVGRRRRKSSDVSSVGSASKLRDFDDWQDPRVSTTDDDLISPYSDSSTNDLDNLRPQDLSKSGTYVIRRGRKKERKILPKSPTKSLDDELEENRLTEVRRFSNTFDNIKSLLKENKKLEGLKEPPSEFANAQAVSQPDLVSVVSITHSSSKPNEKRKPNHVEAAEINAEQKITRKITSSLENGFEDRPLPDSPDDSEPVKITSFAEKTKECNGITITTSKSLDVSKATGAKDDVPSRRSVNNDQYHPQPHPRFESKIPVNLLIEGEIVKKALNENRRQLEKVSDAIKEIESVKNSGANFESDSTKRWRNGSSKRNSFDSDSCERRRLEAGQYDNRQVGRKPQQPPPPPPHAVDVTDATNKSVTDVEFDRRRLNGGDVYSSGRRRTGDLENHKNDTKQIENVIDAILEDSKNPDFQVSVEVLEFPPLPPSPVEEADEESSDVGGSGCNGTATGSISVKTKQGHANRSADYRPRVPPHRGISLDSSKDHHTGSLNTRSMDAAYARRRRMAPGMANRREVPVERRTLPTDLPGPSHRRPFSKRHSPSTEACSSGGSGGGGSGSGTVVAQGSAMQTSCSLPETPVFARGSDIPRTPQHASGNPTQPRRQPGWYAPATATTGDKFLTVDPRDCRYRRNNPGLEQAIIGTELLRLAGGPNRGWYPTRNKPNQPRPASIEHLERLNSAYEARLPGAGEQRKPLTLPTNITPNKYFGQSKHTSTSTTREALRRVTSLLIKKGGGSKDGKNGKDNLSPSGPYAVVAGVEASEAPKKKGFFKNFWKRSRHYSLENQ